MKIKGADPTVCRVVISAMAQKYKGTVTASILDFYRNAVSVTFGLSGLEYGINLVNGEITAVGDSWGKAITLDQFKHEFELTYTQLAVAKAMRAQGFNISTRNTQLGVLLQGVKY
jgi:hypothetical protein